MLAGAVESDFAADLARVVSSSTGLQQSRKYQTSTAGDTFVIPKGTPVVWEVTETLRKFYMIVEG